MWSLLIGPGGPGGNLLIGSDQVAVGCQVVLASWRELLRPVDDGRLDEAAAAQPEEGGQVPQHAQTAAGNKQTNKQTNCHNGDNKIWSAAKKLEILHN